jgi:hypothetical protein
MAKEKTGPQTLGGIVIGEVLPKQFPSTSVTYQTYRDMRKDPTIALARWLAVAPVLAAPWSVEAEDDAPEGAQDFISEVMEPHRIHILRTAFYGNLDYGWQGYEKVFEQRNDGKIGLRKLKPLLQDLTDILVVEQTGAFAGLYQAPDVTLRLQESLNIALDVEGTDWYGQPLMENVRSAHDEWDTVNDAAKRYDEKVAGSHWVIKYPIGTSVYQGVETDNFDLAQTIIGALQSSGAIAIPRRITAITDDLNKDTPAAWSIELMSDKGSAKASFIDRQQYLDALKVRGLGLPERSVLEGVHGTKAEAEAHADFAITNMELRHKLCVQHVNWHLVNQLLRLNYGAGTENTVYIEPAPITDNALEYLRSIYKSILDDDNGFLELMDKIDVEALMDRVNIPVKPESNVDLEGTESDVKARGQQAGDEEGL